MVAGPATWPVQVNGEAQVGKALTAGHVEHLRPVRSASHLHDLPVAGQQRPHTGRQRLNLHPWRR